MNEQRLLERFLRYVQVDTTAQDGAAALSQLAGPDGPGADRGRRASARRESMTRQDQHGIVLATVPATGEGRPPVIAFCAHLDTSPETTGAGVKPQVIDNYAGGDIVLPGDPSRVIRVADNPELEPLRGRTLITTDGTTLLGADDKAGVAVIMETAAWLVEHPEIRPRPGADLLHLRRGDRPRRRSARSARDSGPRSATRSTATAAGEIDVETFSADQAVVDDPRREHPSLDRQGADDQRRSRAAADFLAPPAARQLSPETTDGREGFLHPYDIARRRGRGEDRNPAARLRDARSSPSWPTAPPGGRRRRCGSFPRRRSTWRSSRQYRNMAEGLTASRVPSAMPRRPCGGWAARPKLTIVRGGTDGSRLTELGLPTPNLSCGEPQSPFAPGMGLPGGNGRVGRVADGVGRGLGR